MVTAKPEARQAETAPAAETSASTVDVAAPEDLVRLNLRQKLAEVRRRIGYIQKRGHNERFNYSYVTAADIAGAIGDLLAELGVIVIPRLEEIAKAEIFFHGGLLLVGLDEVDLHDRYWRFTVRFEVDSAELRNRGVIDRASARTLQDFDPTAVGPSRCRHTLEHAAQVVLFECCALQPEPDCTVTQRGFAPFWVSAQIQFLVGHFGPAVLLHPLPERGLCLYQPLRVFPVGAYFDQDSVGPVEGPVVRLFCSRDLQLMLELCMVLGRDTTFLG
ncbi:MAG: ERF family protein [Candidatus Binataceae bacterium]